MKKTFIIIYIILIIVTLYACELPNTEIQKTSEDSKENNTEEISKKEQNNSEQEDQSYSSNESVDSSTNLYSEQIEKENKFIYSPFTGKLINSKIFNRVVMASIENSSRARPQAGLDRASIVYEFMVEGGITRFLALYWEDIPDKIGPIRSVRSYMIEIAEKYNALLLHSGASPDGFSLLNRVDQVVNLDQIYNGKYYWRSSDKKSPHNLYTRSNIKDYLEKLTGQGYKSRFNFNKFSFISSGREADEIIIDYWGKYNVLYRYDLDNNNYKRFIYDFDNPHLNEKGKQITCNNIIVQRVKTRVKDDAGRLTVVLEGEGEAIIFKNGNIIKGTWKSNKNKWTYYYNKDGERVTLNPGSTWIQVVPNSTDVQYISGQDN
ncbi:MAG: DUF3048 domain-containing protein [Bacillota bacterium]